MTDTPKKRILIFSTAYFPFVGGAEVVIQEICNRVPEYAFDMITAKMKTGLPRQEQMDNIRIHRVGIGIPMIDKLLLALAGHWIGLRLHARQPYALAWAMMASYGGFAALSF